MLVFFLNCVQVTSYVNHLKSVEQDLLFLINMQDLGSYTAESGQIMASCLSSRRRISKKTRPTVCRFKTGPIFSFKPRDTDICLFPSLRSVEFHLAGFHWRCSSKRTPKPHWFFSASQRVSQLWCSGFAHNEFRILAVQLIYRPYIPQGFC